MSIAEYEKIKFLTVGFFGERLTLTYVFASLIGKGGRSQGFNVVSRIRLSFICFPVFCDFF